MTSSPGSRSAIFYAWMIPTIQTRLLTRIRSIIDRDPHPETDAERTVMEVLIAASKGGDNEASDLLVFGDLGSREVAD